MDTNSSQHHKFGFHCYFLGEDFIAHELWDTIFSFSENSGIASPRYTISRGLGLRRQFRDSEAFLSPNEIRSENELDDSNSFSVRSEEFPFQSVNYFPTPLDGGIQRLSVTISVPEKVSPDWKQLAICLAQNDQMVFINSSNQNYSVWQNCMDADLYPSLYGKTPEYSTYESGSFPHVGTWLDVSRNPGRVTHSGLLPRRVEVEVWLGPVFWQLAPCKKEDVLAAGFFLEVRDTPNFLYLKSWPHPFTRPDGEQGRIQQKLWRLLFHEDCEWPPGSGGIADEPMYGPPELMP
jgi:hypothetical protein